MLVKQKPYAEVASPDFYKVLLQNEHVKILEMIHEPGQIDEWHRHPPESVYFEKGGTLKIHLPNGETIIKEVVDGEVMWNDAWTHQVENIGDTTVKAIIVENMSQEK